jgi:hypothetical protein
MAPTLLEGDHFFVSKTAYGYSRYSVPFGLMPIQGRIFGKEPERGILSFSNPKGFESRLRQEGRRPSGRENSDDRRRAPHR